MQELKFTFSTANLDDLGKTGIYAIVNKVNDKFYVGSASAVGKFRCESGFYLRWTKHLLHLRRNTHHCIYLQNAWNKYGEDNFEFRILEFVAPEFCIEVEQDYLDYADKNLKYNSSPTAGSPLGVKRTEATKEKLSKPFKLVSPRGQIIEGTNLKKFAKENNLSQGALVYVIKNKYLHHKGYTANLECHKLYLEALKERGLTYCKTYKKWVTGIGLSKEFPRKRFNTKEEAERYRDKIEEAGYTFKIQNHGWKDKVEDDE